MENSPCHDARSDDRTRKDQEKLLLRHLVLLAPSLVLRFCTVLFIRLALVRGSPIFLTWRGVVVSQFHFEPKRAAAGELLVRH